MTQARAATGDKIWYEIEQISLCDSMSVSPLSSSSARLPRKVEQFFFNATPSNEREASSTPTLFLFGGGSISAVGLLQKIGRFGESDEFRRIGQISENPTFKRLRETEIRPILQIRPILGNVRFFVTGPWELWNKSRHIKKSSAADCLHLPFSPRPHSSTEGFSRQRWRMCILVVVQYCKSVVDTQIVDDVQYWTTTKIHIRHRRLLNPWDLTSSVTMVLLNDENADPGTYLQRYRRQNGRFEEKTSFLLPLSLWLPSSSIVCRVYSERTAS